MNGDTNVYVRACNLITVRHCNTPLVGVWPHQPLALSKVSFVDRVLKIGVQQTSHCLTLGVRQSQRCLYGSMDMPCRWQKQLQEKQELHDLVLQMAQVFASKANTVITLQMAQIVTNKVKTMTNVYIKLICMKLIRL